MPTATIPKAITAQQAATALQEHLGEGYKVSSHGRSLTVRHAAAWATVRVGPDGEATTFRVHGGGLIVGRIVNELGIARTVTAAIKETFGPTHVT